MREAHAVGLVEFPMPGAKVPARNDVDRSIRMQAIWKRAMTDAALESFRRETRDWLEKNCPQEMRRPMLVESDTFWGGRNATFQSEAQRVWFERVRDKK